MYLIKLDGLEFLDIYRHKHRQFYSFSATVYLKKMEARNILCFVAIVAFASCDELKLAKDLKFKLNDGNLMPMIGLGTYQLKGSELIQDVLDKALGAGYRLIDTAKLYENEKEIGEALKVLLPKHNLTRQDIFITTKLAPFELGGKAYESLKESIKKLDCEYVDLYLIHWPGDFLSNASDDKNGKNRIKSWELMVKGVKDGLAKSIGVSNFNIRHLTELSKNDHGIKPAVNQVECNPNYPQIELKEFLQKDKTLMQAYFSLGGTGNQNLLKNEKVGEIAKKLGKSPAQILLRWAVQQNIAVIPKATKQNHLEQNIDLNFVIPEEEIKILNSFPQNKITPDPETIA
ncbi:unnamed protein product [Brassicogethes aeneus]|uniref:NADP-dependent oxidoreductase domain-containing protein n=1 Tax=Brassicogethes aeneus TaxID=1431903 RepID=A0A9P0ASE6_BRAAE|nr:unnamed protein product [Brassicogethes aeneus]